MPRHQKSAAVKAAGLESLPLSVDTPSMEASLKDSLPDEGAWQLEPKWQDISITLIPHLF